MRTAIFPASPDTPAAAARRRDMLDGLAIMDTPSEREFDTIVQCVQRLLKVPIALISLIDDQRQWFKARCGVASTGSPIAQSLCVHAIQRDTMMVVPDLLEDPLFSSHPATRWAAPVRFYAGVPIRIAPEGREPVAIGTLCAIDVAPRQLTDAEGAILQDLAHVVESLLGARAAAAQAAAALARERETRADRDRVRRQLDQAERVTGVGGWRLNLADNEVQWSDRVFEIYDLEPARRPPPCGETIALWAPADQVRLHAALAHAVATGEGFDVEATITTAQGRQRRVRSVGEVERGWDGAPVALVGVFRDVTAENAAADELTRLAGAAGFGRAMEAAIAEAREVDRPLALALVDCDGLRAVNDHCGHLVGDEVLRGIAATLAAPALAGSFAARLAGDEFALILTDPALLGDVQDTLDQLLGRLGGAIDHAGGTIRLSATIGAAWLTPDLADAAALLGAAEETLRTAKRLGRGTAFLRPMVPPARAA